MSLEGFSCSLRLEECLAVLVELLSHLLQYLVLGLATEPVRESWIFTKVIGHLLEAPYQSKKKRGGLSLSLRLVFKWCIYLSTPSDGFTLSFTTLQPVYGI